MLFRSKSSTPGTPATITTTNWTGVTGPLTIKDITATNAVDLSGIESYDAGGNTGITFKYPHLPVTPVMKTMRRLIASGVIN